MRIIQKQLFQDLYLKSGILGLKKSIISREKLNPNGVLYDRYKKFQDHLKVNIVMNIPFLFQLDIGKKLEYGKEIVYVRVGQFHLECEIRLLNERKEIIDGKVCLVGQILYIIKANKVITHGDIAVDKEPVSEEDISYVFKKVFYMSNILYYKLSHLKWLKKNLLNRLDSKKYSIPLSTNKKESYITRYNNTMFGLHLRFCIIKSFKLPLESYNIKSVKDFDSVDIAIIPGEMEGFVDYIDTTNKIVMRRSNSEELFIKDDGIVLNMRDDSYLTPIKRKMIPSTHQPIYKNTFIVIDIETFIEDGVFLAYAIMISSYNNGVYRDNYFYLSEYKNSKHMMIKVLEFCMREYPNCKIYAHNLGGFDGWFFYNSVTYSKKYKVSPFFLGSKIARLEIEKKGTLSNDGEPQKIIFLDSLLILRSSLKSLTKSFNVEHKKSIYPYLFVKNSNLNYVGEVPDSSYFSELNSPICEEEYQKFLSTILIEYNGKYCLREQTRIYMLNDVRGLLEVMMKFNQIIQSQFSINAFDSLTLTSLSLEIFLKRLYKPTMKILPYVKTIDSNEGIIHIPSTELDTSIRKAYFGGRVEVFANYVENIYWYDVNSLYPTMMLNDMPTGISSYSNDTDLYNYFGFCYAQITIPNTCDKPCIPFRTEKNEILFPTGIIKGLYTSELLKYLKETKGYKIEVYGGYQFDRSVNLFKSFVETFYEMKKDSEEKGNTATRTISKLFLNSLYGRFGFKDVFKTMELWKMEDIEKITDIYPITLPSNLPINSEGVLDKDALILVWRSLIANDNVSKDLKDSIDEFMLSNTYQDIKIFDNTKRSMTIKSVAISAFVTSYSHIFMDQFLNIPDNKCYYTDTDSIFLEKPLSDEYIGNKLGQFKFEGLIKRAYFISPKLYCLILDIGDNKEKVIIKSRGVSSTMLTEGHFIKLLKGDSIEVPMNKFYREGLSITIRKMNINIQSSAWKRQPILGTKTIQGESIHLAIDSKPYVLRNGIIEERN